MTGGGYTTEDINKAYDNFFREQFGSHPQADLIFQDYLDFKKDIHHHSNELDDREFEVYCAGKKAMLKGKIKEYSSALSGQAVKESGSLGGNKKIPFFENLKHNCSNRIDLEGYMSTIRYYQLGDLLKDAKAEKKVAEFEIVKELKKVSDLEKELKGSVLALVQGQLRKDDRAFVRMMDFKRYDKWGPVSHLLVGLFVTSLERKVSNYKTITECLVDLYNISHHFALKSQHFLLFNHLSDYFKSLLFNMSTKRFEDETSFHAYFINQLTRSFGDEQIFKGIKSMVTIMIGLVLEYCDTNALTRILQCQDGEHPLDIKCSMSDFIDNYLEKDRITKESIEIYKTKVGRLVMLAGFALQANLLVPIVFSDSIGSVVRAFYSGPLQYFMMLPTERMACSALEDKEKEFIDVVRKSEGSFNLDDFLSCSDEDQPEPISPKSSLWVKK